MRAMILAAGFGTRLWPLTIDRTKPAIPVAGRPLVGYVAEYLARFGISQVLVNLHHQPASVRAALGRGERFGVSLEYIEEPEILGTSGALDNARAWLEGGTFLVINGKIVTDIDLHAAWAQHRASGALATLVLRANPARERFSRVIVREGWVQGFGGMPVASDNYKGVDNEVPLMFTGIQILEPEIFRYIPRGVFSHSTTDVYPPAIAQGEKILGYVATGSWYELSTLERYLETSLGLLRQQGRHAFYGEGVRVAPTAEVENAVIWENVEIGEGASVCKAIVGAGVKIAAGGKWERVVVVRADLLAGQTPPEKARPGFVAGANFVVPLS